MKMIIDIPEEDYIRLRDEGMFGNVTVFKRAVREGIPLGEPCTDAISRDMALEKMADYVASGYADSAEDFEEYSKIICQLPPVKPAEKVGQWIPVSERLPEENGEYLVTVKPTFKNMRNYIKHCDFALNLYLADEYDFVDKKGVAGFYKYDSEYGYYEMTTEVIAWMPLPEPYKASPTGAESEVQDADSN